MTARSVWIYVALAAGAFGLVAGLGALERNPQVLEGPRKVASEWFVYGPQEPEPVTFATEIVLDPQAQTATLNGENVAISWGSYAETGYSDNFAASGTVRIYAPSGMLIGFPMGYGMPLQQFQLTLGAPEIYLILSDAYETGGVTYYDYDVYSNYGEGIVEGTITIEGDDEWHEYDWSLSVEGVLTTRNGTQSIGTKGITHAKENYGQDAWDISDTNTIQCSFGPLSWSPTETGMASLTGQLGIYANFAFNSLYSPDPQNTALLEVTVNYNQAAIDASGLDETITPSIQYGSYTGADMYVEGSGNTLTWGVTDTMGTCADATWYGTINPPRVYSFTGLSVKDMDGSTIDVDVTCPAVQVYDASAAAWNAVTQSVSAWQAFTATPDYGLYSWDATPPPDGALRTLADVYFYIDVDSAQALGLDGFAGVSDTSDVSFGHDGRIIINGWPLDKTGRDVSPFTGGAGTIAHNTSADLYGPADALGHDDWTGTGSVTSPNAAGSFSVSGSGSLAVDLPSNFGSRLAQVTSQNFPTGMPGAPQIYWYHKADVWSTYDGDADQSGGTWSEPAEAVYCARGFPCLKLNFTTYPGAGDDELTVTITGKTYTVTDTHVSDSTRQTDFEYTSSAFSHEYTCQLSGGVGYCYLAAPSGNTRDPDLEVVETITVSGFSDGSWVIAEPQWIVDPAGTTEALKFFEHWAYKDGGFSGVVDSTCLNALMDSTEGNSSHDNVIETRTVRNFDYVVGATSGIDITGAKSLSAMINSITNVCDAWAGTLNSTTADAMTLDADSVRLKTLSCTDIRPVVGVGTGALDCAIRVARWSTVAGLPYDFNAEKITEGAIHGPLIDEDGNLARSQSGESVWRYENGSWVLFDTPVSDAAGYWVSASGEVYDATPALYDYGTGLAASDVTNTGRFAAREYDFGDLLALSAPGVPWLHWMAGGWLHIAVAQDGVVRYYWTHPFSSAPTLQDTGAHPFGETGGFSNPFITSYSCGWLLAGATDANGMRLSLSRDFGGSWEEIEGATLVSDLRDGCVAIQDGILAACGWKDNTIVFRSASGTSYAAESLYIGGPTQATICAAAEDTRSQVLWVNGVLEALVEGVGYYRTRDWGTSWTQVPAPHIADGMTGGTCAFVDGEMLASGIEAGEVRVESAYRDDRTPEAFYIGGPTHIAVVEASARNAVEAVHGERWVATGEDGLTLYRTRNPADGFAKII